MGRMCAEVVGLAVYGMIMHRRTDVINDLVLSLLMGNSVAIRLISFSR